MRDDGSAGEQRFYRVIFEQSPSATAIVEDDGEVLSANRAARDLERELGIDLQGFFTAAAKDDPDFASFRAGLRVDGRASASLRVGDPVRRWLTLDGFSHGACYVVTIREVTRERRLDEELRHLRQLEALGLMTGGVVHDLGNVITTVMCSTALLAAAVRGQERPSALARDIEDAGTRAIALVRRVLRILRREPSVSGRVTVSTLVLEMRSLLQLVAGGLVHVDLKVDPSAGEVVADREQLEHVLVNLVANSRDAMPRGGTVTVATTDGPPLGESGEAHDAGAYVGLTVSDAGEGMTPEVLERVHERFFTTKEAGKGSGLGLASARRFVGASGGWMTVRSAPAQGTTVAIYLPRAAADPAPPSQEPVSERQRAAGAETVLVVEPDDAVRGAVREILGECGYRVIDAPSGETALRQVLSHDCVPDLVLADVGVPGIGGAGVMAELHGRGKSPRLLWMSGLPDRALDDLGVSRAPLLRKAFTPAQLARSVRQALEAPHDARDAG